VAFAVLTLYRFLQLRLFNQQTIVYKLKPQNEYIIYTYVIMYCIMETEALDHKLANLNIQVTNISPEPLRINLQC